MLLNVEKGIHRYAKAYIEYMKDYDKKNHHI